MRGESLFGLSLAPPGTSPGREAAFRFLSPSAICFALLFTGILPLLIFWSRMRIPALVTAPSCLHCSYESIAEKNPRMSFILCQVDFAVGCRFVLTTLMFYKLVTESGPNIRPFSACGPRLICSNQGRGPSFLPKHFYTTESHFYMMLTS